MGILSGLLSGPLPGMLLGLGSSGLMTARSHFANQANRQTIGEATALADTEGQAVQDQYAGIAANNAATNNNILGNYQNLFNTATATQGKQQADLLGGYNNRLTQGMSMLDNAGNAQREEINRQYSALGSQTEAGLRDRGFSGSLLASNALGVQNQKDRSTRALDEQIQQQRLGVYSNLSGDYLNALGQGQSNALNLQTSLGGQLIGAQATAQSSNNQAALAQLGYQDSRLNRRLGLMTSLPFQSAGPGNAFDAAQAGFNSWQSYQAAQTAQTAGQNDWFGPTAATVLTAGLLA